MKTIKIKTRILSFLAVTIVIVGCNFIKNAANSLNNLTKLKFKLGNVNNFKLNNVSLSNISSANSISAGDILKLTQAVASKKLPVEFTLGVLAQNPNAVSQANTANSEAIISNLAWKLYIDNVETVQGVVSSPIKVPTGTNSTEIPITMHLDLFKFFGDKNYEHLLNLALAIGGKNGSASRLKIEAKPTVSIAGFPITYPNYITIVNSEFSDK